MKRIVISLFLVYTSITWIYPQAAWNWPEDRAMAEEKNAMYTDQLTAKNYAEASEPLNWLLENAPNLNASIYINGARIYKELAKVETDAAKKAEYQEKSLMMYDKRIEHFGKEADVLNRKAYATYAFYKNDKTKFLLLFELYEKAIDLGGVKAHNNNLVPYMDVMRKYKMNGGDLTDNEVLTRYDKINAIIDQKLVAGEDKERMAKTREFIDKMLTSMITVDCDFIQNNLGEKLKEDPSNTKLAKKILGLSLAGGCSDLPIFLEAAKIVQADNPDFGMAKIIGIKSSANGDLTTAFKYYNEAISLTDDGVKKADIYYEMAVQLSHQGRKPGSRANALKALEADPSRKSAYKLIGDLYLTSFETCKKGESRVEDRAVFIAAYEMYKKAGDTKMMKIAQNQFPTMEDIFTLNLEEGQTTRVGCWINQTIKIKKRVES